MKVRKLAVALALAGGLGSGVAQALGLGEIELQSYLNEPLDAEIDLRKSQGIDPDDVFVNIASDNDYQRVGIDRNTFLTKLQFEVTTSRDGNLIVNVSSREPLREPYLNFLLEVTWPSGRLMREYAVLVDPPVYAEESGMEERVSAPATRSEPAPRQQPRASSPGRDARVTSGSGDRGRTFGPTNPSDTLWKIAASIRPDDSVSIQQVMLAVQDLNPDAFIGNNINRLKRGEVLRLPELDEIRSRSAAEANRQVAAQNDALSSPSRTVDATDSTASAQGDGASATSGDELRLIAADDSGSRDREDGGSAGGDGQTAGGVDAGSAVAMEELESSRRENQELNSRVDDLQDQVETLQRLLELKDSQLAEMQQMAGDDGSTTDMESAGEDAMTDEESAAADEAPSEAGQDGLTDAEPVEGSGETADEEAIDETTGEASDETEAELSAEEQVSQESAAADQEEPAVQPSESVGGSDADDASQPAPPVTQQPASPAQQPDKGFPGNIIDAITNNPMYQIALGGGLIVLLLLLLLLARRNANREKAFYEQMNGDGDESEDSFELSLDDEDAGDQVTDEPMAEAETYIAYGQLDKAAETLETAISREPSRSDLRLKLLGVYADTQDRASFEKQFREIEALDDEQAIGEAAVLRDRLDEAEAMPSIDDLESQLRSDSFGREDASAADVPAASENDLADETLSDQFETSSRESSEEFEEFNTDFSDVELGDSASEETLDLEGEKSGTETADSDLIEYDLSGLEKDKAEDDGLLDVEPVTASDEAATRSDEEDLSFDFEDTDFESTAETEQDDIESGLDELSLEDFESLDTESELTTDKPAPAQKSDAQSDELASFEETAEAGEDLGDLDESFLDELDAELDKVADDDTDELDIEESSLDDLELDVSDEDLALMEEFSDPGDSANPEKPGMSLDEEPDLEDSLFDERGELPEESPEELSAESESLEGSEAELADLEKGDLPSDDIEPPLASDALDKNARQSVVDDIDESELGDDDDFDFLAGTDEAATKLDLARAYIEMGDVDGARDILEEVALEGDDEQKTEAQDLLKNLS